MQMTYVKDLSIHCSVDDICICCAYSSCKQKFICSCNYVVSQTSRAYMIYVMHPSLSSKTKDFTLQVVVTGNLGNLPIIIIPAVCREKGSPFGAPETCYKYGMAYVSLSMAIGAVYFWSYVYNIVRVSSSKVNNEDNREDLPRTMKSAEGTPKLLQGDYTEAPLVCTKTEGIEKVPILDKTKQYLRAITKELNLKAIFAPSTTGAVKQVECTKGIMFHKTSIYAMIKGYFFVVVGFLIGVVPQIRNLMIGGTAPLRVITDSASLLGDAAIPIVSLVVGGNLLRGLKGSGIEVCVIVGIIAVRYIVLPLLGIVIVKGAVRVGMVHSHPLYQFVLLLQYAVPPAMNIGTVTQLFGAGESECSVVMLWTYAVAPVSLTLWSTLFM
ncbi:hypothetical protein Pint_28769 [Pistacia integerrima]|uniref:Uncharacterized protein n=1 Tax=Pistacia integerrima TaxID=434235 RepID=A0ACC0YRI2_9ROSI|nr:hypothetical protein Pint_28769 [Pistacia integerrima]